MLINLYIILLSLLFADLSEVKDELNNNIKNNLTLKLEYINDNVDELISNDLLDAEKILIPLDSLVQNEIENLDKNLVFNYYFTLSIIYQRKNEYEMAIEANFKAFQVAEKTEKALNLAKTYLQFGELYFQIKDYKQSAEYNLLGIKFCEDRNDTDIKYNFLLMLGKVYYYIENYKEAESYLLSAISETLDKNDYDVIAETKLYLGKVYLAIKDIEKAENNLLSIEILVNKINNLNILAKVYRELIIVYTYKNNTKKALDYGVTALDLAKKINNNDLSVDIQLDIAKLLINKKEYEEAKVYLEVIKEEIENSNDNNQKLDYYFTYLNFYEMMDDFKNAFKYQKKYLMVKDELLNDSKNAAINDALKKYESEKKEKENEVLRLELEKNQEQKKVNFYFTLLIISIALLISGLALFLYLRAKKERKLNKILQEKNREIEDQKEELELLNRELVDRNVEIEEINNNLTKSEAELRELNATKDKFLSIIAHDLKNPIAGIMLTSELLVSYIDKFDKVKLEDKLREINRTSVRLKDLLETLLEWSRASTGQIPFNPKDIDIDELINNISQLFSSNLENKNIKLEIENPACCRVIADDKMLDTVFRNIISNAIKFTPEGGKIIISSLDLGDKLKINIQDTGVGIPVDKIPLLFSMASNYSTIGTKNEKGTGLGLVLCKEFIDINKGEINIDSKIGKGTTFSIILNKFTG